MFIFFALIFFGGKAVAGPAIGDSLDSIVVGFFLWTLATRSFRGLASDVMNEVRWGTLERLFMSPYGLRTVMSVKTIVNVSLSIVWGGIMLFVMMLATGQWLTVDLVTVIPLLVFTLAPIIGIGFLLGGMAILYKRIENLLGIISFGFVGLIAAPVGQFGLLGYLPATQGSYMTRIAMEEGVRLWQFSTMDFVALIVPALVYLLVGFGVFQRMQRRARHQGALGQY